jgi:inosine-uridine nucleoside N-ribohydrolase
MIQKIIIIADPGIDTAFALALALHDPTLDVIGLIASAGNVSAQQATQNIHILVNQVDAPKWPRFGAAVAEEYGLDGTKIHGPDGLGGVSFPPISLHQPQPGEKLIGELLRANPKEVTIVILGPCTMLARALDRDPDLVHLINHIVCMGGSWHEPGNASAVAEFHFLCDPLAARRVMNCGVPITLLPLDVTRKLVFSPSDLLELPAPESATCRFLRQIVPYGIRATSNLYGIEGFYLKDVLGIAHLALPGAVSTERVNVDVETRGELTRGMSVVDMRSTSAGPKNVHIGIGVDVIGVRDYINRILRAAC